MATFTFSDLSERDMDILFMEEFATSPSFRAMFLYEIKVPRADLISIEHSKTDNTYGESDLTVIFETENKRIGLLIEDKIDAVAMDDQAGRYEKRGELGVRNGDYDRYEIFIVAPEKYLAENSEAKKYPHQMSYETILEYFSQKDDARADFKVQQIQQAIEKHRRGYQAITDDAVTSFWEQYTLYAETNYPSLGMAQVQKSRPATSTWIYFPTAFDGSYIAHKGDRGYLDLTYPDKASEIGEFHRFVRDRLGDYGEMGITVEKTGKSAAVRMIVPKLDFHESFEAQEESVRKCFEQISTLASIQKKLFP